MGELTLDNIGADFGVAVRVAPESTLGLNQVVIHNTKNAEVGVMRVVILGEREMEATFEPVAICPCLVVGWIRRVAKPAWIGFRDAEQAVRRDLGKGGYRFWRVVRCHDAVDAEEEEKPGDEPGRCRGDDFWERTEDWSNQARKTRALYYNIINILMRHDTAYTV